MNLEKVDFLDDRKGISSGSCSICFDFVVDRGERSIAKLQCGHEFHLDCIGSAFNAKGAMQCPNCRKVEKGRWLYASGHRSSSDFDFDAWLTEDYYDLSYSELPFGFQWCPFRGITQLASLIEEGESELNSYHHHESMGSRSTTYGDPNTASSSTHACPYLTLHSHPHALQSAPQFGPPRPFVHPHPYHGSGARGGSNLAASMGPPGLMRAPFRPGAFYGNPSRHHQEAENMTRHFDQFYGPPLPWIPLEGESQWWGPFNPGQAPAQLGGSFVPRDRAGQSHGMPRPPPPSYM